jgi:hypothetical protein
MQEVCVVHEFNFNAETVFEGLSNHVEFLSTSKIFCHMTKAGDLDANGTGALREVRNGSLLFEEAITAFDSPHAYEYKILALRGPLNWKLPIHHEHGRLELQTVDEKTRVVWTSRFYFTVPLIGAWLDKKLAASISQTFLFFLKRLDQRLQNT